MIELRIEAMPVNTPVVTTPESINQDNITVELAPVVAKLIEIVAHISGVTPARISLSMYWMDGTEKGEKKERTPSPTKVPSWMS